MTSTSESTHDPRRHRGFRLNGYGAVATVTIVLCVVLFVWPVVMILLGIFQVGYPGTGTTWALDPLVSVLTSPETGEALVTSVWLALLVTVTAKSLSFYLAWVVTRTDTPLRRLVTPVMLVVLALPPLFFVISWALLGQPRVGLLNQWIGAFTGEPSTLINTSTFAGIVFVSALKSVAFGYFLLIGPLKAMSHRMEEAAAIGGAGRFRTFWTVNVPVMAPAITAAVILGFIVGLEYFEAPLMLGAQDGVKVVATEIYSYLNDDYPPRFAEASVFAAIMLVILIALLVLQRFTQRRRSFETIEGKAGDDRRWGLGRWRWAGTAVIVVYAALALALPAIQLVIASFQPYFGASEGYTLANYQRLLADPLTVEALRNTALLGVLAGFAVMVLALAAVFVARHGGRFTSFVISKSTWLPVAMPGSALALGILWILLGVPFARPLYGSFAAMLIALVIVAMPIAMRNLEPAIGQVKRDLEEAAWVSGASRLRGFVHAVARLVVPSFLSGWLLTGILIAGNLVMPLMVGSPLLHTVPRMTYDLYTAGRGQIAAALSVIFLVFVAVVFGIGWAAQRLLLARRSPSAAPPVISPSNAQEGISHA